MTPVIFGLFFVNKTTQKLLNHLNQKMAHFIWDVLDSTATLTFDLPEMLDQEQSIKQPTML